MKPVSMFSAPTYQAISPQASSQQTFGIPTDQHKSNQIQHQLQQSHQILTQVNQQQKKVSTLLTHSRSAENLRPISNSKTNNQQNYMNIVPSYTYTNPLQPFEQQRNRQHQHQRGGSSLSPESHSARASSTGGLNVIQMSPIPRVSSSTSSAFDSLTGQLSKPAFFQNPTIDPNARIRVLEILNESLAKEKIELLNRERLCLLQLEEQSQTCAKLQEELTETRETASRLPLKNQEIAELKQYMSEIENEMITLKHQFAEQAANEDLKSAQSKELEESLSAHIEEMKQTIQEQENKIASIENHCETLLSENSNLSEALIIRIEETQTLKEELELSRRFEATCEANEQMIRELQNDINQLLSDNQTLYETNLSISRSAEQQLQASMKESQERETSMLKKVSEIEAKQYNDAVEKASKRDEARIRELENAQKSFIFEIEKLKAAALITELEINELRQQAIGIEEERVVLSRTKTEYQLVSQANSDLEKRMLILQDECNTWKIKFTQLESASNAQLEQMKRKQAESQIQDNNSELITLRAKWDAYENTKDALLQRVAVLEQKSRNSEKESIEAKSRVDTFQRENSELKQSNGSLQLSNESQSNSLKQIQASYLLIRIENERLHGVLGRLMRENGEMKRHFDATATLNKRSHADTVERIQEYENINAQLKAVIANYQEDVLKLQKQNAVLRKSAGNEDAYENKIELLNKEYQNIVGRCHEAETYAINLKARIVEQEKAVSSVQQLEQQLNFMNQENDRLQKFIVDRCKQVTHNKW